MQYAFEHVHLKASDPEKTANWYVRAFDFEIFSDRVTPAGARFIECKTTDGVIVRISGPRDGDVMRNGDASTHYGLEHLGLLVNDLDIELRRIKDLGADLLEGPIGGNGGPRIAFIQAPDDVRIELLEPPQ